MHLAIFHDLGNIPSCRELFIIKHKGVAIMSLTDFNTLVLTKSTPDDDFDLTLFIAFSTWETVTGVREKWSFLPFNFSFNFAVGSMLYIGILLSILTF